MPRVDNPNRAYRPPDASLFKSSLKLHMRESLDGEYRVWSIAAKNTAIGDAYKWYASGPNYNAGSGTTVLRESDARAAVDEFMRKTVHAQREELAGHTLPPNRLERVNGQLVIVHEDSQFNRYFTVRQPIGEEEGSVGEVEYVPLGPLGPEHYLRRFKRVEGKLVEERGDPEVAKLVEPLVQLDVSENYWGRTYGWTVYPVAADVANALFPLTDPPYEPRPLLPEDEIMVLRHRAELRGDVPLETAWYRIGSGSTAHRYELTASEAEIYRQRSWEVTLMPDAYQEARREVDTYKEQPDMEERLERRRLQFADDAERQRDLPIAYDSHVPLGTQTRDISSYHGQPGESEE